MEYKLYISDPNHPNKMLILERKLAFLIVCLSHAYTILVMFYERFLFQRKEWVGGGDKTILCNVLSSVVTLVVKQDSSTKEKGVIPNPPQSLLLYFYLCIR